MKIHQHWLSKSPKRHPSQSPKHYLSKSHMHWLSIVSIIALISTLLSPIAGAYGSTRGSGNNRIASGLSHTAVIKTDNTLWAWGQNSSGQLGTGNYNSVTTPTQILSDVISVSAGDHHTAAVKNDGSLWLWGDNTYSQLGAVSGSQGYYDSQGYYHYGVNNYPAPTYLMNNVATVACGRNNTAAIKTDGSLWVWGAGIHDGNPSSIQSLPVQKMSDIVAVACGYNLFAAIDRSGNLWVWGQIAGIPSNLGNTTFVSTPFRLATNVAAVCCGSNYLVYTDHNGYAYAWSGTSSGAPDYNKSPWRIDSFSSITAIDCNPTTVSALDTNGALWSWNSYTGSQSSVSCILRDVMFMNGQAAIKTDGSVWTWDINNRASQVSGINIYAYSNSPNYPVYPAQTYPTYAYPTYPSTSYPNYGQPSHFTDVSVNSPYLAGINWAVQNHITNGTGNNCFSPDRVCTVGEIVTFIWRAHGSPAGVTPCPFPELQPSSPYYTASRWAYDQGLLSNEYSASMPCTRAMALYYIWRAHGSPSPQNNYTYFADLAGYPQYQTAICWGVQNRITDGTGNNCFSPAATCTRGQIATFLYRSAQH